MIIDGKFIEENSIPLNRLMGSVVTSGDYSAASEALNLRISKIENLQMANDDPLQVFNANTVNHFATQVNDTSTASAPAHTIKAGTVTDAMLATALKNKLVYIDANRTISASHTFTGTSTYTASSASTNVINVTKGNVNVTTLSASGASTLKAISGTTLSLSSTATIAGATTMSGNASVGGNLTVTGNLTVSGTTTTVNSSTLVVADKLISVNKGGTLPSTSTAGSEAGMEVDVNGYTDIKKARIVYKGDGWYVRNHSTSNSNTSESKIVTESYLTSQGFQTTSNLESQIKTVMQKYIAMGNITLAGTTGVEVDLATKCATFAANITNGNNYDVFVTLVTPNTGNNGTTMSTGATGVGEIQVVKTANKKFKIFNSGTASSMYVHWVAINKVLANVAS